MFPEREIFDKTGPNMSYLKWDPQSILSSLLLSFVVNNCVVGLSSWFYLYMFGC